MNQFFQPPEGEQDKYAYHSVLEDKLKDVITPFQEYIDSQVIASVALLVCTIVAPLLATLPSTSQFYQDLVSLKFGLHFGTKDIVHSLKFWVNDVLLTIFFFFVGLEIKREFLVGELTNRSRAVFVIFAAVGGMVVPALFYALTNLGAESQAGWGVPMATDTAFALGILSCFKRKLPKGVFTFMAALAIIDDIGAILVIAIFYTGNIDLTMLAFALLGLLTLLLFNISGFRRPWPYIILGIVIWVLIHGAGIHGTLSGILVAFLIPARPEKGPRQFLERTRTLLKIFEQRREQKPLVLEDEQQHVVLEEVEETAKQASTPLQRWESQLELPVAILVLPIFALINAGIQINWHLFDEVFKHGASLGILCGLVLGKPIGVLLFSWIALYFKLGRRPEYTNNHHLLSVAFLTGMGFTMSLFIANLAFTNDAETLLMAKASILLSSLIAGVLGLVTLIFTKPQLPQPSGDHL